MISENVAIPGPHGPIPAYVARPDFGVHPAVIVLEGVYGFDDELKRITDLVASAGYVGCAIDYFHRNGSAFSVPFTDEGRAQGVEASKKISKSQLREDVAATVDWLNSQDVVTQGDIATWGFGFGGTAAFVSATLPGLKAAVVFYGQSIDKPMPSGDPAPLEDAAALRAPLLLVFGGRDELIEAKDVERIASVLRQHGKRFELQTYPNVGHSFFRDTADSVAAREAADAWDRVQAFLRSRFA